MDSNLDKYRADAEKLIAKWLELQNSMQCTFNREAYLIELKKIIKEEEKIKQHLKELPNFCQDYQAWYSESIAIIKQLLPDRLDDFKALYEKSKSRKTKEINVENYVIEDALHWLSVTSGDWEKKKIVWPEDAIPKFSQQVNILKSILQRWESSLFEIKSLVQADLFDSEIMAATELNKKWFTRGAWAIAGVILEKHLWQVCNNHNIIINKKNPTTADYNDLLKTSWVYEVPTWRKIQHLGDLRNLCDHNKKKEPTKEDIDDLIEWVDKIIKTVF